MDRKLPREVFPDEVLQATYLGLSTYVVGVLIGCLLVGACSGRSYSSGPTGDVDNGSIATNTDKFPHALHSSDQERFKSFEGRGLACSDCHSPEAVKSGEIPRPGEGEHAPCDICHAGEFMKPPGQFCRICHESVDIATPGATTMQPFPAPAKQRMMPASFSHKSHLDTQSMETKAGFHLSCEDCHSQGEVGSAPGAPRHPECARCHDRNPKLTPMSACTRCHAEGQADTGPRSIRMSEEIRFTHGAHKQDRVGAAIACQECHASVVVSTKVQDVSLPTMEQCAGCHQDPARSPERVRVAQCQVCHSAMLGNGGNAPRSHRSGPRLPDDHTLDFRTNHADQAADSRANCQYCHENLSGDSRDSCFQCHEVMRPKDHRLGWQNEMHGREASVNRNRCATCHQVDYCTACHSIPPRSHQPMDAFRLGGHAQAARFGLSSCMACHTMQGTCASCHRGVR